MINPDDVKMTAGFCSLVVIQLLLFVDDRPSSKDTINMVRMYLDSMGSISLNHLQVIEIREQPHLLEYFRLMATPALIKIAPEPRHTLAGSNLIEQLQKWYPRWLEALQEKDNPSQDFREELQGVGYSAELLRLSDEIFRLNKEKEKLIEQLHFKDQVMAMLAHDLRSPLSAASLSLETLELAKQNPSPTKSILQIEGHLLKQTRVQMRTMNQMITDTLEASKNPEAQFSMQWSRLYLQALCQEIVDQYAEIVAEKGQILKYDLPQNLPPVYADAELIRQVIINLLENAIKYTSRDGEINLCILHRTNQKMQVSVSDTGLGIPQEKQLLIFEGHFRLQRDQSKDGYGLGLSFCRNIIRAHYGQLWVDSELGQGSSFYFTLPVYQ